MTCVILTDRPVPPAFCPSPSQGRKKKKTNHNPAAPTTFAKTNPSRKNHKKNHQIWLLSASTRSSLTSAGNYFYFSLFFFPFELVQFRKRWDLPLPTPKIARWGVQRAGGVLLLCLWHQNTLCGSYQEPDRAFETGS